MEKKNTFGEREMRLIGRLRDENPKLFKNMICFLALKFLSRYIR